MLAGEELDKTMAQLTDFRVANDTHQATLSDLLERYTTLLSDYSRLRSDYEEERDSRERYKQMARGHDRSPFVLVLVDGDGYAFGDHLLRQGAEGGQMAATRFLAAVKDGLRSRGLEHCKIMVRVYANLVGLSRALSKVKLAGPEKRSLAPFAAAFTRSGELFDFVDAGETQDSAEFKVRATLRQFADNTQCKHIYFAGCHDVAYLPELRIRAGNRDQITLVRTPAFRSEYSKLGMRTEELPGLFRDEPLDMPMPASSKPEHSSTTTKSHPSSISAVSHPSSISAKSEPRPFQLVDLSPEPPSDSTPAICTYFKKGACKFGNSCKFQHVKPSTNGAASAASPHTPRFAALAEIRDWRQNSGPHKPLLPMGMPRPPSAPGNEPSSPTGKLTSTADPTIFPSDVTQLPHDLEALLPSLSSIPPSSIPVNAHQHRLDAYLPPTSPEDRMRFNARTAKQKLCNAHHLLGACPHSGDACEYDHRPAAPATLACLRQVVRATPCPRKGACRALSCLNGHVCQRADCRARGGTGFCRFPPHVHGVDLVLAEFVPGESGKKAVGRESMPMRDLGAGAGGGRGRRGAAEDDGGWNGAYASTAPRNGSESARGLEEEEEAGLFDGDMEEVGQWRGSESVW